MMRVLVACEFSGVVRDAFRAKGHDAWSCDLLPSVIPDNHIQGNVFDILGNGWDLMIGHPPCTYLSYAGNAHWNAPGRCEKRLEALNFFRQLWEAPIEKICLENPKGCASPTITRYTQEIQPFYFGDAELKTTWLWLKNLPPLKHAAINTLFESKTHVKPKIHSVDNTPGKKKRYFTDGKTRNPYKRAVTFQGIAQAMAEQWNF